MLEHIYAITFKRKRLRRRMALPKHGRDEFFVVELWQSYFSDGTPVKITIKNYEEYDGVVIDNFYYIEIGGFYSL